MWRHKYRNDEGDMEYVPTVLRWGQNVGSEQADEGQSAKVDIVVDDPDSTLNFVGHRRWTAYELSSDTPNEIIFDGITQAVRVAHEGGDITNPIGRVWTVEVNDLNTLWTYRVQTGSGNERPAETDVERMEWLAATEEMSYVEDVTLLSTDDPVNMDEADVRGQTSGQVADQCAQESGKNYWLSSTGTAGELGAEIKLWYGSDGLPDYTSPLFLSNDPADLDMAAVDAGTATTYPLGADTELRRDYARQYDAAYGEYQDGAKYLPAAENPYAPIITASHRDIAYPAPEIKTASRMKQRLLRVLRDHATPDEIITTTIVVPSNKATSIRAGMRVAFRATHFTDYTSVRYLRVMTATPTPIGFKYSIRVELQGPGEAEPAGAADFECEACNTVTTDAERNGFCDFGTTVIGQVYTWRVTNTAHDVYALTEDFEIGAGGDSYAWPGDGPSPHLMPTQTGTLTAVDTSGFTFAGHANYAPGTVTVDECWTIEIWVGVVTP